MPEKDIVFITIDSLRADHVGCLGYEKNVTPNLDKLAEDGNLFEQAFSTGAGTSASFFSMFTSLYPLDCENYQLPPKHLILFPEVLKENGFSTAAFHSNPRLSQVYNYGRGFDKFYDGIESPKSMKLKEKIRNIIGKSPTLLSVAKKIFAKKKTLPYEQAEAINQRTLKWVENAESPFFLWLHYMDVHPPYIPYDSEVTDEVWELNRKYSRMSGLKGSKINAGDIEKLENWYDSGIKYVDKYIKKIIDKIRDLGLDPHFAITSDHGGFFDEPQKLKHASYLHDAQTHIPLIINGPKIKKMSTFTMRIKQPVSLVDLAPTILDLAGVEKPSQFRGASLLPLIEGKKLTPSSVISEVSHPPGKPLEIDPSKRQISYLTEEWKYIYNAERNDELYNRKEDPLEEKNLIDSEKEVAEEFKYKIMERISEIEEVGIKKSDQTPEEEEIRKRLEELGYIE